jgi:hypothetical protein
VPFIASCAALQDWDAVFLFAYSHGNDFEKTKINDFFNIEGNPMKMPLMPIGSRIFLGSALDPRGSEVIATLPHDLMIQTSRLLSTDQGGFLRGVLGLKWQHLLSKRIAVRFDATSEITGRGGGPDVNWTSAGTPGTGRFTCAGPKAAVFAGFAAGGSMPIDVGPLRIDSMTTPFATIMVTSADPTKPIDQTDRLLLTAIARSENTGMQWDASRQTVENHWGTAPPRIEPVHAAIEIKGTWRIAHPLSPAWQSSANLPTQPAGDHTTIQIGAVPAIAYVIER